MQLLKGLGSVLLAAAISAPSFAKTMTAVLTIKSKIPMSADRRNESIGIWEIGLL
jgi:hypothetical protein